MAVVYGIYRIKSVAVRFYELVSNGMDFTQMRLQKRVLLTGAFQ
jgi:hypothetical protein